MDKPGGCEWRAGEQPLNPTENDAEVVLYSILQFAAKAGIC